MTPDEMLTTLDDLDRSLAHPENYPPDLSYAVGRLLDIVRTLVLTGQTGPGLFR